MLPASQDCLLPRRFRRVPGPVGGGSVVRWIDHSCAQWIIRNSESFLVVIVRSHQVDVLLPVIEDNQMVDGISFRVHRQTAYESIDIIGRSE